MLSNLSMRTKMLILVILITSLPLAIVGIGNYNAAKQTIIQSQMEQNESKVLISSSNLSSWITTRLAEVEVMSRTGRVRFGSTEERNAYFRQEAQKAQEDFHSIGFADLQGNLRLSDGGLISIGTQSWFKESLKGATVITGPILRGRIPVFIIQVPVYDHKDQINGMVHAAWYMEGLSRKYSTSELTKDGTIMLYNQDGLILDYPNQEVALKKDIYTKDLPYAPVAAEMLGKKLGCIKIKTDSGQAMLFYTPVQGTSWHLAMQVPLKKFEQPLESLLVQTVVTFVLAEAVIILLLLLLTNKMLRRVKRVLEVTEAASAGHFDVDAVPEKGNDELAKLSRSVNTMSGHLRQTFDRMEAIINQNDYAFIVFDTNFQINYFSQAAERMLGYQSDEVLGKMSMLAFIAEDDMQAKAAALSRKLNSTIEPGIELLKELQLDEFSHEREWKYVRKDGTQFPVSLSSNYIRNREGVTIGVVAIARDISEQKRAEKAQNQQLRMMEAAKDLIAILDEQGHLLYLNPAGRELLGLANASEDDRQGHVPEQLVAELLTRVDQVQEHGFVECEELLPTVDGKGVYVSKIVVAHRDEADGGTFFSCIARDITEQKRILDELEEAKRQAEDASSATSDFLARMSHEIRTPLAGIIGLNRLLQKTELSELQRDYSGKMRASSEALLHIINDILDFAKSEAGKIELSEVTFKPEQLLQKLADLLSMFVGGKERFECMIETPANLPGALIGDALRLEQVLLNLCVNAIKFTNYGHVRLKLSMPEEQPSEGAAIRFEVEDTGIGISDEQLSKLFEPFMQAGSATSRKYGGTGLGLVIAKSLVEMMGGTIHVESRKGVGSRFYFTLQFALPTPLQRSRYQLGSGGKHTAWVVEDYPLTQLHWNTRLEEMGLLPLLFSSWRAARERLERTGKGVRPDVILLDFEMSDMYGIETWQSLHELTSEDGIATIALTTAFGREELLKLPAENRPEAILVKPIGKIALYQALSTVLEQNQANIIEQAETAAAAEQHEPAKGMILLAEDNVINQLVAVELLREWGFAVEVAENGREALRKLEEGHWDLVLMDIHMPEMDGDEATRIIRRESRFDRLPIVALTANVIRQDHERYMQLGMNDVLTKPIDAETMYNVITKWIRLGGNLRNTATDTAKLLLQNPAAASLEETSVTAVQTIPGLDMAAALERVNGKRNILLHMLELFVRDYKGFDVRVSEALSSGNYTYARRMAHTLKGVAGNLSAAGLTEKADHLERVLKVASGPIDEQAAAAAVSEIGEELARLLTVLDDNLFDSIP